MFRELIEKDIRRRGIVVPAGEIFPTPSDYTRYCSMFMFGADIQAHVKTNNSVRDFKGKIYTEAIWFDIDFEQDVNEARLSAIELIKRLNTEYQINPDSLFIYFSGLKGFHIALMNRFLNFNNTDPVTADKVKDFVRRITAGINHVDLAIYEPVRIFRIENSRHEKSGLYKLRISFSELQCELEDIKKLAVRPRKYPHEFRADQILPNNNLINVWINSGSYIQEQKEAEYKGNLFQPPQQGARNKTLLIQACTLFRKSELSSNAILDIINNAAFISSINTNDKISDQELRRIVANAERLVGDERKKPEVESIQVKSFGEWVPEWENYTLQHKTDMSLCFHDLNELMQGRLKGKLGVIMGYGGAKKSLYALNICLRNEKEISVYSTMEMSVPQLINRVIDHEVRVDHAYLNASVVAADLYRKDVNEGRKFLTDLAKNIGNRMQITQNSRMTTDGYKSIIQRVKETAGTPSILVVDGLSMMGGKGTETEVYSRNSAELKELANEENMLVLLICHVSKGAEKYTRDLSRYIRGSEKILDNCDFYMTMSQIQEGDNPEIFRQDIGFVNFHDKRGSGKTVDLVYEFKTNRLKLVDCNEDPRTYYEPVKKKQSIQDF